MARWKGQLSPFPGSKKECEELMTSRSAYLESNFETIWKTFASFRYDPTGEIIFEVGAGGGNGNSDSRMGSMMVQLNNASR
jgi:hypothetical protein